jgi:quinohemoprotein ethanol dehydrogenase
MSNALTRKSAAIALAFPLLVLAGFAQQPKRVDTNALRNAAKNADEWLTYGRDYAETHYSPLKQIDTSNVSRLGLAWSWDTQSPSGGRIESTPLFSDGVLYGSLAWNVIAAVDARTGKEKWRWEPEFAHERQQHISEICCGPVNKGLAVYNGKIYAGLLDGRLIALDQRTGKRVWQVQTTDDPGAIITGAVRVVKGKVIVGNSGAEQAVRGYFTAYDAETGKLAWRFYTVPGDPSKPFEHPDLAAAAKTWTGEWWKMGGGGTTWDGIAYDSDADILYVGTGNGGPWTQIYRSPGGGDNLYLASVIAVKPDTGKLVWYFQETPGDDWDYTSVQPMILADITIAGRPRKVLMHAPKNGFFYVLDRITGEFISGEKFAKRVTWATGLDPKTGRPIEAKGARARLNDPVLISPGPGGAHNWQPMSFSPLTGLVYIPGQESSYTYRVESSFEYNRGTRNMGIVSNLGPRRPDGTTAPAPPSSGPPAREPEGAADQPKATGGFLVAWDPQTQKERWRHTGPGGTNGGGGTLATAGNLVFHGPIAYDATTGEKLWESDLGGNNVTPITYLLDGKQYVTLFARNYPDNRLFTFVLDGKAPLPPPTPAAAGSGR